MNLPPELVNNVRMSDGERGSAWLASFPNTLHGIAARWGLAEIEPYSNLTYHFVAKAMRGATPVVVKLGPSPEDIAQETATLRAMAGRAVEVLESAPGEGAILLSRADPGLPLEAAWSLENDEGQSAMLAHFIRSPKSSSPAPNDQRPSVKDWLSAIDRFSPPFASEAIEIRNQLLGCPLDRQLLHGDLHHGNILSHGAGHILIDPKGVWGPPAFEVYALLHNPVQLDADGACRLLDRRLQVVNEVTGIPVLQLAAWGFIGVVMSAAWDLEDGAGPSPKAIAVAEQLWTRHIRP